MAKPRIKLYFDTVSPFAYMAFYALKVSEPCGVEEGLCYVQFYVACFA
jgi:hypothetical protein